MSGNPVDDQFADAAEDSNNDDDFSAAAMVLENINVTHGSGGKAKSKALTGATRKTAKPAKKSKTTKQQAAVALLKTATAAMGPPVQIKRRQLPASPSASKRPAKHLRVAPGLSGVPSNSAKPFSNQVASVSQADECHVNCIPTYAVHQASRLVAQNLRLFPEASPGVHLQAAVAIETFGKKVFLPYIQAAHSRQQTAARNSRAPLEMNHDRVFYATLLALREVLAQNAHTFFQFSTPSEETSSKDVADDQEEQDYAKILMATTIVISACQAAGKNVESLLEAVEVGDMPAPRAQQSWSCRMPNNKMKHREDALAWKVGYNMAHSLRVKQNEADHRVALPKPTAVYMSIVEQIPAAIKKSTAYDF